MIHSKREFIPVWLNIGGDYLRYYQGFKPREMNNGNDIIPEKTCQEEEHVWGGITTIMITNFPLRICFLFDTVLDIAYILSDLLTNSVLFFHCNFYGR